METNTNKSLFVVFPMAERTIIGLSSGKLSIRLATSLILSAEATEDPPNFITQVKLIIPVSPKSPLLFSVTLFFFSTRTSLFVVALQVTLNNDDTFSLAQHNLAGTGTGGAEAATNAANPIRGLQCKLLLEVTTRLFPLTPQRYNALAMFYSKLCFFNKLKQCF